MTKDERIEKFLTEPHPMISPEFLYWLKRKGFFTAPASTKYHGNYEGGLYDHSAAVMNALLELTENNGLLWQRDESPLIVGMFHDLCKIDCYRHPVIGEILDGERVYDPYSWEYNPDTLLKGHGDKSVMLLSEFMALTEEEVMCIRYHMGAFTEREEWKDYTGAIHEYPNVLWTHHADMIASHIHGT